MCNILSTVKKQISFLSKKNPACICGKPVHQMAGGRALAIANESFLMEPWPRWGGPSHGWGHINELPLCRYSLLKRGRLPPGPLICTKAYLARGALFIREQVVGINPSSSLPWYAVGRRPVDFPCGKQFHGHRFGLAPREGVGRRSS